MGTVPRTALAREAGLPIGATGGIVVDAQLRVAADIWACGDCVEWTHAVTDAPCLLARGSLATRTGRAVGDALAGSPTPFPPVLGSTALRLGEVTVATTGLTQTAALAAGLDTAAVWGCFDDRSPLQVDRAGFAAKLVWERGCGRILGWQGVGAGEVGKRADVVAAVMRRGGTLQDLFDVEPAFSPAINAAVDPVQHLAALARTAEAGGPLAAPPGMADHGDIRVLDVRGADEVTGDLPAIAGALTIPLGELDRHLQTIPRDCTVVVVCARGPRSLEAVRRLQPLGFTRLMYLSGGMKLRAGC